MSTTVRIVTTPEVLHGKPRIEGTRIGVLQVGTLVREGGRSVSDIVDGFDLDEAEVRAALEYYDKHPEVMETLRAQKEARRQAIRRESRADEAHPLDSDRGDGDGSESNRA